LKLLAYEGETKPRPPVWRSICGGELIVEGAGCAEGRKASSVPGKRRREVMTRSESDKSGVIERGKGEGS